MFRLTVRAMVELALTLLLTFMGLGWLLGTIDEYKARKAFNKAMDNYSARSMADVHEFLQKAISAKPDYAPPQEVMAKLLIDEGRKDPRKYADAKEILGALHQAQERRGQVSLPVLVGTAVTDLEAARARNPSSAQFRAAITEARVRLDQALEVYPDSGDLHVNLATVALLAQDTPRCVRHLKKVQEVGNISPDALPFLYNLSGLAALNEGRLTDAVAEFAKVEEFDPNWEVPRLNLAAAYARSLLRGGLDEATSYRYYREIRALVLRLKKAESDVLPLVFHALAVHNIRMGEPDMATEYFREAEKYGELSRHAKLNRAITDFLVARKPKTSENRRQVLLEEARPVLERALRSDWAEPRDKFLAAAILGTIYGGDPKKVELAIEYFEQAGKASADKDPFVREALPRVQRSLASLHYMAGNYKRALEYLEQSIDFPQDEKKAARMLRVLGTKPVISEFQAVLGSVVTEEHDVRVRALLATPAAPEPVSEKNVRLSLVNQTTETTRELRFVLAGSRLHALVLNLPQGRQRIELQLTDSLGNTTKAASEWLDIDREPPRVVERKPAPGSTVRELHTIEFRLFDALGSVDFSSADVLLKYPTRDTRLLVGRGKLKFGLPNGALQRGATISENVRCPVPIAPPPGEYGVMVTVKDVGGRELRAQWGFTLR